jgi:hypothetical protein
VVYELSEGVCAISNEQQCVIHNRIVIMNNETALLDVCSGGGYEIVDVVLLVEMGVI